MTDQVKKKCNICHDEVDIYYFCEECGYVFCPYHLARTNGIVRDVNIIICLRPGCDSKNITMFKKGKRQPRVFHI